MYRSNSSLLPCPKQLKAARALDALLARLAEGADTGACKGAYLHGSVGSGKTMLMDLFLAAFAESKALSHMGIRRTHFHEFMLGLHAQIKDRRSTSGGDAVGAVAEAMAGEFRVLCFDEFQLTDIADAWILSRTFSRLWSLGTVILLTSNRPIGDIYKNGSTMASPAAIAHQVQASIDETSSRSSQRCARRA